MRLLDLIAELAEFEREPEAAVATWQGFVFVNMAAITGVEPQVQEAVGQLPDASLQIAVVQDLVLEKQSRRVRCTLGGLFNQLMDEIRHAFMPGI